MPDLNILLIMSDQLRRQALSLYGDPNLETPNIDALAQAGVHFPNASSTYPICAPTRFTLMTGEYAHTRKIPGIEYRMSPAERTLADEFNEAGYETIYVGKWHLDGGHARMGSARRVGMTPVKPVNQGRWQKWFGFELRNGPFDTYYFEDADPTPRPIEGYQTDGLFDLALEHLLARERGRPFCMVISVEPPHNPLEAPADLLQAWEAREIALPPNFSADDDELRARFILDRRRYYAMVENLDANIGKLTAFLAGEGLADDTVVMLISDHGELGGSHGLRAKQWPYEESVGVPLIVRDPLSSDRGGRALTFPTCTEDWFPTLLGLAGLTPRNPLHGLDLTPFIRGHADRPERDGVLLEFVAELRPGMPFYDAVWRGFRSERYKYTVRGDNHGGAPWQFFDLQEDPYEQHNRIDDPDYRGEIARHHALLRARMDETDDHFVLLPAFGIEGLNTPPPGSAIPPGE